MTQKYELSINSGDGGNITIDAQPFHDMLAAHNERPSPNWKERAKQLSGFVGFPVEDWSLVDFEDEDGNFAGENEYGR
jgi:hypothetical protein